MSHVATRLPRLPSDLDVWQIFTPGSEDKIYRVPVNIKLVVAALEWLRLNNPLCTACVHTIVALARQCTPTSSSARTTWQSTRR